MKRLLPWQLYHPGHAGESWCKAKLSVMLRIRVRLMGHKVQSSCWSWLERHCQEKMWATKILLAWQLFHLDHAWESWGKAELSVTVIVRVRRETKPGAPDRVGLETVCQSKCWARKVLLYLTFFEFGLSQGHEASLNFLRWTFPAVIAGRETRASGVAK